MDEVQSELLARTSPTIYDVLIALCGGLAGIIALSTKEKGNVIPGVAIATALMPPLCTAGFGLATGNLLLFFRCVLFVFLSIQYLSVWLLLSGCVSCISNVRSLWIRSVRIGKEILLFFITLATMCPAVYLTYGIVKKYYL